MLYGGMLLYGYVVRVARVDCGMLYGGMLLYFNVVVVVVAASSVHPPPKKKGQHPLPTCKASRMVILYWAGLMKQNHFGTKVQNEPNGRVGPPGRQAQKEKDQKKRIRARKKKG